MSRLQVPVAQLLDSTAMAPLTGLVAASMDIAVPGPSIAALGVSQDMETVMLL